MSLPLLATTELDAINILLNYVGEQPVNSISQAVSESNLAQRQLHQTSRQVQSKGLKCNTIINKELVADINGEFHIPSDVLDVTPTDSSNNFGFRDNKLYDLDNDTSTPGRS